MHNLTERIQGLVDIRGDIHFRSREGQVRPSQSTSMGVKGLKGRHDIQGFLPSHQRCHDAEMARERSDEIQRDPAAVKSDSGLQHRPVGSSALVWESLRLRCHRDEEAAKNVLTPSTCSTGVRGDQQVPLRGGVDPVCNDPFQEMPMFGRDGGVLLELGSFHGTLK